MKKFLAITIVLLFLVSGTGWARKKKSDEADSSGSGTKHHSRKGHSKGSKGSRSKSDGEFKVESEINHTKMTFDFKDDEKGKKGHKSRKKKEETSNSSAEESQ